LTMLWWQRCHITASDLALRVLQDGRFLPRCYTHAIYARRRCEGNPEQNRFENSDTIDITVSTQGLNRMLSLVMWTCWLLLFPLLIFIAPLH
jgi:hypothetical protein